MAMTPEEIASLKEELNIQQALSATVLKGNDAIDKRRELLEESHGLQTITSEQYNKQIAALDELEDLYKTSGKEAIRALQLTINLQKEDLKVTDKRIEAEKNLKAIKDQQYKFHKSVFASLEKLGLGAIKGLKDQIRVQKELNLAQKVGYSVQNMVNYAAATYLSTAVDIIIKTDQMRSEYLKSTQASVEMARGVANLSDRLRASGQDWENAGKVRAALYQSSVAYLDSGPAMRKEIEEQTSYLLGMGVSAKLSAQSFDAMVKVMGYSAPRATKELESLGQVAEDLNLSLTTVLKDFTSATKRLAYSGDKLKKVFIGLEAQSRATGISTDSLMTIVGRFDTFEGAADAVSRFNGILGGPYLNSIEMVYMSEEKRIKTMRNSLKMSGRQFKSMSKFEKLAVMNAAGITDMDTAMRMFGTSTRVFEDQQRKAAAAAEEQKNFAEAAKNAMTVVKKLQLSFMSLIVALEPFLEEYIIPLVDKISELTSKMDESDRQNVVWGAGIAWLTTGLWDFIKPFVYMRAGIAMMTKLGLVTAATGTTAVASGGFFAGALTKAGALFAGFKLNMIAFATALKGIAASIAGFFLGIPGLVIASFAGIFIAAYNFSDDFRAWTNQFAENMEQWWKDAFDFDLIDYLARKIEDAMQYIRDFFPGSAVKHGPLMDLEIAGEKVPDMLAKGFEKGYKVKVVPRVEALAKSQKVEAANLLVSSTGQRAPSQTLTPTKTQTDQKQNVQLVIDYKGVHRLLGEIGADLLEDAIGLRIA